VLEPKIATYPVEQKVHGKRQDGLRNKEDMWGSGVGLRYLEIIGGDTV
jgi:hypothetical protein